MKLKQLIFGVLILLFLVAGILYARKTSLKAMPQQAAQATTQAVEQAKGSKTKGPAVARVVLVEYSDFQCPACQAAEPLIRELLVKYQNDVQFIFRHFPLAGHIWSSLAHQAAECANDAGQFWPYHDRLYDTQKEWSTPANPSETFLNFAKDLGINLESFSKCMVDEKVAEKIRAEREQGTQLYIQSTPTFFINGERVVGPVELKMKGENMIRKVLGLEPLVVPAPVVPSTPPANQSTPQTAPASEPATSTPAAKP